ncbi:class F sortase [Quadrisphaera sp. INWT6]|uniref:class F sortase n=1 Tax=Quadrisphaera sp. INWT6 TaxID=2596917 RepID=UPI0028154E8B|nr:class F sortase [Quadrisphaera sp. INWT6]
MPPRAPPPTGPPPLSRRPPRPPRQGLRPRRSPRPPRCRPGSPRATGRASPARSRWTPTRPTEQDAAASTPVEVAVPRIGVDTPLVPLGIASDGSLEVPGRGDFDRAGWLTTSAVPGEAGASVIAGHVDSTSGPAVFYRLHELVPGDEVRVQRADGEVVVFTVDEVRRVGKDAFPTAEVYGPQPGPVLRLVTCGGEFDRATGHYTDNVIAFASAA